MHNNLHFAIIITLLLTVYMIFVGIKIDSPAPGCVKHWPGIFTTTGGCMANYAIIDVKMEPEISCLRFDKDICTQPTLQLNNNCDDLVYLNKNKISNSYMLVSIPTVEEIKKARGGDNLAFLTFSHPPNEDKQYILNGIAGDKNFTISFTVTKALC